MLLRETPAISSSIGDELNNILRRKRAIVALCEKYLSTREHPWSRAAVEEVLTWEQQSIENLAPVISAVGGYPTTNIAALPETTTTTDILSEAWKLVRESIDLYHASLQVAGDEQLRRTLRQNLQDEKRLGDQLRRVLMNI